MTTPVGAARQQAGRSLGRVELVVFALPLAWFLWRIWRPDLWFDEIVTADAAGRSWPRLVRMLGNVDVVHGAYYALMKIWSVPGFPDWWLRTPSAVAMAGTCVVLYRFGVEAGRNQVGVIAAALWTSIPAATRYAQEARSTAIVTFLVTLSGLLLIRGMKSGRLVPYALALAGVAALNFLSLVAALGHVPVVRAGQRAWLTAVAPAGLLAVVMALATASQVYVVLPTTSLAGLIHTVLGPWIIAGPLLALAALGATAGRSDLAVRLQLAVAVLPVLVLFGAALSMDFFAARYAFFVGPAVVFLAAEGIARAGSRRVMLGAVVIVFALGVPQQVHLRDRLSHSPDDWRIAAGIIQQRYQEGDGIAYASIMAPVDARYYLGDRPPATLERTTPQEAGRLTGDPVPAGQAAALLGEHGRLWLVELDSDGLRFSRSSEALVTRGRVLRRQWLVGRIRIRLVVML